MYTVDLQDCIDKMDLECLWRTAGAVLRQDGIHEGRLEKQQMQGAKEAVNVGK